MFASPPIGITAYTDDEEYAEVEKRLSRQVYGSPATEEPESRRKRRRYDKWHEANVVMEAELTPDQLKALRGKTADWMMGKPRPFTEEEKRQLP